MAFQPPNRYQGSARMFSRPQRPPTPTDAEEALTDRVDYALDQVPGFNKHDNLCLMYSDLNKPEFRHFKLDRGTFKVARWQPGRVWTRYRDGSEETYDCDSNWVFKASRTRVNEGTPLTFHLPLDVDPILIPTYVKFLFHWNQKRHGALETRPAVSCLNQNDKTSRLGPVVKPAINSVDHLLALANEWAVDPTKFWERHNWDRFHPPAQARPQTPPRIRFTFTPATPETQEDSSDDQEILADEMSRLGLGTGEVQAEVRAFMANVEDKSPEAHPKASGGGSFILVGVPSSEVEGATDSKGGALAPEAADERPFVVVEATDAEAEGSSGGAVTENNTEATAVETEATEAEADGVMVEAEDEGWVGEPGVVDEEAAPVIVEAADGVPEAGEQETQEQAYLLPAHGVSSVTGRLLNAMRTATPAPQALSNWVRSNSSPSAPIIDEARAVVRELSEVLNTLDELLHDPATGYPYPTTGRRH